MPGTGREETLRWVVEHLGSTRVGREVGLVGVETLEDLRAALPLRTRKRHAAEVESRLGFGGVEVPSPELLGGAHRERDHVVGVWRSYLGGHEPQRIVSLRGRSVDPIVDDILVDDLSALGGELTRLDRLDDPESVMTKLETIDPDVLVVPSALTVRHLEQVHRTPLERKLQSLRIVLCEHDMRRPIRSRVRLGSAGWIHRSGRIGLATVRPPRDSFVLAMGSQIIELLPYSNPEEDGRRVYAKKTILPENAVLGQRYELVVTSPLGFLRMRTVEHVKVVGFDAPSHIAPYPRPRVVRLAPAPPDVKLEGCTVSGAWLTASIRQALHREDPALVAAEIGADPLSIPSSVTASRTGSLRLPDVFRETELAWAVRTGVHKTTRRRRPRGLLFKVELQGYVHPHLSRKLAERIDANLRRRSEAYAYLRERDELTGPRVFVVPAGTRVTEEHRRIQELLGGVWVPEVRVTTER